MPGALTLTKSILCTVRNPLPPSPTPTPSLSLHSSSRLSNFSFIALPRTLLSVSVSVSVQRRSGKEITVQARLFHDRQHQTEIKGAMFRVASGKLLHSAPLCCAFTSRAVFAFDLRAGEITDNLGITVQKTYGGLITSSLKIMNRDVL